MDYYEQFQASEHTDLAYQGKDFSDLGELVRVMYNTRDARWMEDVAEFCRQMEQERDLYRNRSRVLQEELAKFPA